MTHRAMVDDQQNRQSVRVAHRGFKGRVAIALAVVAGTLCVGCGGISDEGSGGGFANTLPGGGTRAPAALEDFAGEERDFLEDVAQFNLTLDLQAQVDLANDVCNAIETNYESNTGNNFREANQWIPADTGLTGIEAQRYRNTIAEHFCPRFFNPNQR